MATEVVLLGDSLPAVVVLNNQGPKGNPGADGHDGLDSTVPGPRGETGPEGLTAYEVAVEAGFVGTVAEWLYSLSGEDRVAAEEAATRAEAAAAAAADAVYGRHVLAWTPATGGSPAAHRASLQALVDQAVATDADLLINVVGVVDISGTVTVSGRTRIFGLGRGVTTVHQTTKPLPTFYVTGQDVAFEDFTGSGDGPSFTMSVETFQNYNVIRVQRGAHGFAARRLGFINHYIGILVRNYPNDPLTGVTEPPVRTERVVIEDLEGAGVWSVLHGGPFDSPSVRGIRGSYVNATGHASTLGHAPHLVYINAPTPADGVYTDAYYTRGGSFLDLNAWGGPDYIGAAFSFKFMQGTQIDNLVARDTRGIIEMQGLRDVTFGLVTSTDDKYPATGSDATRASVSFNTTQRTKIEKLTVGFAATDHGKALRFENGSTDNTVESLTVIERGTVDRSTGDVGFAVYLQGLRNTVRNLEATNLGKPKWCAVSIAGTGGKGILVNPRINGAGYLAHIRVAAAHTDAIIDYDPLYLTLDRTITSSRLDLAAGARTIVRDRSIGQVLPSGFVDEFDRGVTVNGLIATDDGKTWLYRDSGSGNAASWQARVEGVAAYVGGAPRAVAMVDGVSANGVLRMTIGSAPTGHSAGLAARAVDWGNYLGLACNYAAGDGRVRLVKRVGGVPSDIAISTASGLLAVGSVVELVLAGTSVSARVDGVEVIPPTTVADFASVTTHGLLHHADETALTWDRIEFTPS